MYRLGIIFGFIVFGGGVLCAQSPTPITITNTTNPPPGNVGVPYAGYQFTASGGTPPYTWAIFNPGLKGPAEPNTMPTGERAAPAQVLSRRAGINASSPCGGLPPGLLLNSNGSISGTPTATGTYQ